MTANLIVRSGTSYACDVVVIDDYLALTTEIADALRRCGLSTQIALNGAAATALAEHCTPRVALVDCALPDGDGIGLIRQLGDLWPDTKFLVISGQVAGISADMAHQLRIHAFLNKPLPMRALAQAVERLVRGGQNESSQVQAPRSWLALGIGSPSDSMAEPVLAAHQQRPWAR